MATISETLIQIRNATNCNITNLKQRAKLLVQAAELTSTGRGTSAAAVSLDDCSKLLLVVLLNGKNSSIVKRIKNVQKYKFANYTTIDDTFRKLIPEKYENLNIVTFLNLVIKELLEPVRIFPQVSNISLTKENFSEGKENYIEKIFIKFKSDNEIIEVIFSSHNSEKEEEIRKGYLETWSDVTHKHIWNYEKAPILKKNYSIPGGILDDLRYCVIHSEITKSKEYKHSLGRDKKIQEVLTPETRIPWEREECILVLDLYLTNPESPPRKESKKVLELCKILKRRWYLKNRSNPPKKFRNINGVYMFMCNYMGLHPEIKAKGLRPPSYVGQKVWNEFYDNQEKLRKEANQIKNKINEEYMEKKNEEQFDEQEEMNQIMMDAARDYNDDEINTDEDLGWNKKK